MSNLGERLWYAIYSKPQREEAAQFHLRQKGLEVFLPKPQPNISEINQTLATLAMSMGSHSTDYQIGPEDLKMLYEIVPAFRPLSTTGKKTANQIMASESSVDTMGGMPRAV